MLRLPPGLTLVFDGSCDFCTRCIRWVELLDRQRRITAVPFQQPGLFARVGLAQWQAEHSVWAILPDGTKLSGAAAVNFTLAVVTRLPFAWWVYGVPGIRQLQDAAYAWVTRNRHRIPGDVPYCEQYPEQCGD